MKHPFHALLLFALLAAGSAASAKDSEEKFILLEEHRVSIAVPDGYVYSSGRDDNGTLVAQIADPKEKNRLQVVFQSDPDSRLGAESQQMRFLAEKCGQYADGSVEHSYDFKSLAPHTGIGTYCSFTDASLVGREPPKGEFLHVTMGVKAGPGWIIVFTLLSNDTASKEHQALLKLVKESFEEKPPVAPAKP